MKIFCVLIWFVLIYGIYVALARFDIVDERMQTSNIFIFNF